MFGVEFGEGGEAFGEAVVGDVEGAAGLVVEDEVVEGLGERAIASTDGMMRPFS